MSKYKYLLFDCDDTVLDFKMAEVWSIEELLKMYNITPTSDLVSKYVSINEKYWQIYEKGELTKEEILVKRFEEFFAPLGVFTDFERVNVEYLTLLTKRVFVIDGIIDLLKDLKRKYRLFIITNGVKWTQEERFRISPVKEFFEEIFISEVIGFQKPKAEYFDYVMKKIGDKDPSHYLVIGDSISSDILGGINAGMDTLWFNRKNKISDVKPTYEIHSVDEYYNIL